MRAMRKEPEHRYGSIEQFASDIRRYLTQEPVLARQGNWIYYSQRFVRRHAFGVAAGVTFVARHHRLRGHDVDSDAAHCRPNAIARRRKASAPKRSPTSCWMSLRLAIHSTNGGQADHGAAICSIRRPAVSRAI